MAVNPEEWEPVYDTQIAPLMDEIVRICQAHGIPCSLVFQLTADAVPTYVTTQLPAGASPAFEGWIKRWQADLTGLTPMSEWRVPTPMSEWRVPTPKTGP